MSLFRYYTEKFITRLSKTDMEIRLTTHSDLISHTTIQKYPRAFEKVILDQSVIRALLRRIDYQFNQISEKDVDEDVRRVAKHTLRFMINQGDLLVLPELFPGVNRGLDLDWKWLSIYCNLRNETWEVSYFLNLELVSSSIDVNCHNMALLKANRINITQLLKRVLKLFRRVRKPEEFQEMLQSFELRLHPTVSL